MPEFDSHRQDTIPVGCGRKQGACADRPNSTGIRRLVPGCEASEAWQQTLPSRKNPEPQICRKSLLHGAGLSAAEQELGSSSRSFHAQREPPSSGVVGWALTAWKQGYLQTSGLYKPERAELILRQESITKPCDSAPEWPHLLESKHGRHNCIEPSNVRWAFR